MALISVTFDLDDRYSPFSLHAEYYYVLSMVAVATAGVDADDVAAQVLCTAVLIVVIVLIIILLQYAFESLVPYDKTHVYIWTYC